MANCEYFSSCFFFNEMALDMPSTTDYLKDKYCNGVFNECTRFRISKSYGICNVPTYIYPNDSL